MFVFLMGHHMLSHVWKTNVKANAKDDGSQALNNLQITERL